MGKKHKKKTRKNTNVNKIDVNVNVGTPQEETCESKEPTQGAEHQTLLTSVKEFAEKINLTKKIIAELSVVLTGFVGLFKGEEELLCIAIGVLMGMLGTAWASKVFPKDRGMIIIATCVLFAFGTIGSLAAIEYVYERSEKRLDIKQEKNENANGIESETESVQPEKTEPEDEVVQSENAESGGDAAHQSKAEPESTVMQPTEAIESTESPISTYVDIRFEDEISSLIWRELMLSTERIGVTGTRENFYQIKDNALQIVADYLPKHISRPYNIIDNSILQDNMEEIALIDYEGNTWEELEAICRMRRENYEANPSLDNAQQKSVSSMNCLFMMGKVNGKENKSLNTGIYNKDNILLYGNSVVDGCAEWWYAMGQEETENNRDYTKISEKFGEAFHHLGGADEMMTKEASIALLALSAVFYSNCVVDDAEFYIEGHATNDQATVCKDLAIVYDKLDNKLCPEDSFYLSEAIKYYNYSLDSNKIDNEMKKKIRLYLDIVEQKKQRREL